MNNWNQLVRDAVEEFKPKYIAIRKRKSVRLAMLQKVALVLMFEFTLVNRWLANRDRVEYLLVALLVGVAADLFLLCKF